jgi:hypothetical protein
VKQTEAAVDTLRIVNPIAEAQADRAGAERIEPAPRPATLDGATIGLFWNGKPQGEVALAHTKRRLAETYTDVSFVEMLGGKGGLTRMATPEQLSELAACDAAVFTTAD